MWKSRFHEWSIYPEKHIAWNRLGATGSWWFLIVKIMDVICPNVQDTRWSWIHTRHAINRFFRDVREKCGNGILDDSLDLLSVEIWDFFMSLQDIPSLRLRVGLKKLIRVLKMFHQQSNDWLFFLEGAIVCYVAWCWVSTLDELQLIQIKSNFHDWLKWCKMIPQTELEIDSQKCQDETEQAK
jgi:hypothetical protein